MRAEFTVRLADMPEALHALRAEMARLLREFADEEVSPHTAARLREVADVFEVGARLDG